MELTYAIFSRFHLEKCTVYSVQFTVCSLQCAVYTVQFMVDMVPSEKCFFEGVYDF